MDRQYFHQAVRENLRKEMEAVHAMGYDFTSMYVGGGTTTVLMDELAKTLELAKKLFQYLVSHAPDQTGKDLIVVNGKMDEETEELLGYLTEQFPGVNITRAKVGPTIATHIGPVFGVFFKK